MNEIVIWENRSKVVRQVLFGALMVLVSVFITIGGYRSRDMLYAIPGVLGTLFFGASFIYVLRGLFVPRPLMKIDADGITDSASLTSVGLVMWDEIESITLSKRFRQQFVDIRVRDEDALTKRLPEYRRFLLKLNVESKRTFASIPLGTAQMDMDELRTLLQKEIEAHGRKLMIE